MVMIMAFAGYGLLSGSSKAVAAESTRYEQVLIQENDTLWNIASMYNPDANDIRELVHEIYDINGMTASDLHPGDVILVPVH